MGSEAPAPTAEEVEERAVYYETWAKDIRAMNGHSVDADHSDATARVLRSLRASLTRVEEERDALIEACQPAIIIATIADEMGRADHQDYDLSAGDARAIRDACLSRATSAEGK